MRWFGRRRKDAHPPGSPVAGAGKQAATDRAAATQQKQNTGQPSRLGRRSRRRDSTQASRELKTLDTSAQLDASSPAQTRGSVEHDRASRRRSRRSLLPPILPLPYFDRRNSREDITALPGSRELNISPHLRPVLLDDADIPYNFFQHSASNTSMPQPPGSSSKASRRPSSKRTADVTPRRKSTKKRRKDDPVREEEIRAMSAPVSSAKRPATYNSSVLRKDTKRVRGGLNRNFERPISNVSLPMEESIHSSMSGGDDPFSYHLNKLDVFSPRPAIRSSYQGQYASAPGLNISRWSAHQSEAREAESRRKRKPTPSMEVIKSGKTVSELANDLRSGDLRAVMERDQRRKEQKRLLETERIKRRLERRAEKDRAREMGETDSPSKRKRKDLEKHLGLEAEPAISAASDVPKRKKKDLEKHLGGDIADTRQLPKLETSRVEDTGKKKELYLDYPSPLESSPGSAEPLTSTHDRLQLSTLLDESILLNIHPAFRPTPIASQTPSPERASPEKGPSPAPPETSVKPAPERIEALPPLPSTSPSNADASSPKTGSRRSSRNWTSFFRRGSMLRNEQNRTESPSDGGFSNVSRESITRNSLSRAAIAAAGATTSMPVSSRPGSTSQLDVNATARTGSTSTATSVPRSRRDPSGMPVRSLSKFREDLPELPLELPLAIADSQDSDLAAELSPFEGTEFSADRALEPSPILTDLPASTAAGPSLSSAPGSDVTDEKVSRARRAVLSASLASVDSEASWLSGRPVRRPSVKRSARNSATSDSAFNKPAQSEELSHEELGMPEEDQPRRLTPSPEEQRTDAETIEQRDANVVAAGDAVAAAEPFPAIAGEAVERDEELDRSGLTDADDVELRTGGVARTPTLVRRESLIKSSEGLLNEYRAAAPELAAPELAAPPEVAPATTSEAATEPAVANPEGSEPVAPAATSEVDTDQAVAGAENTAAAPEIASEQAPEIAPELAASVAPEAVSENTPTAAPEVVSETTPGVSTEVAAHNASDRALEATPEAASEAAPKATPEATADVAPEATPEHAPEAVPEPAPEAKADVTPEAAPEPEPEAAPAAIPEATSEVVSDQPVAAIKHVEAAPEAADTADQANPDAGQATAGAEQDETEQEPPTNLTADPAEATRERSLPTPEPESKPEASPAESIPLPESPLGESSSGDNGDWGLPSPPLGEPITLSRADSIKTGQSHARQVSKGDGDIKLLDIGPRRPSLAQLAQRKASAESVPEGAEPRPKTAGSKSSDPGVEAWSPYL